MKQVPIFFVFSLILLLAGCTVTQPLPTSLPTATLPTTSPTTQPPTSTATLPSSTRHLPDPTILTATPMPTITPTDTATPLPTPQPTAGPTHAPDIIDPSLPPPIGRIYFLWEPIPIPEEHGIHEIHDNNFYILASETMPNDWHTDPALEMVGHPTMRLSPDSTKLAILRPNDTNGDGLTYTYEGSEPADILSFNLADNSLIQLTDNQWNPGVFSWLPDSQSLTYPQLNNLYLISLDNPLHPENLFTFDGYINYHAWSPDGHYLAILHAPSTQPHYGDVFDLLNTETNSFSTISEGSATPDRFLWSPNSQWISFSQYINRGLQLFNISTDEVKELAPFDNQIYSEWSPNEAWLAYTNDSKLFLWDANTETDKQLIDINVFGKPSWSPDGTQIAVSYTNNEQPGIMIVDVANGSHQKLDIGIRASQIIWSPDEEWLLFFSEVDNRAGLYMVHKDDDTPFLFLETTGRTPPYDIYWLVE